MALEYGFFNGTAEDPRYYDADDINEFFKGLITPNGIFANVDNMLQVKPYDTPRMAVRIDTGKAMIDHHWVRNTSVIENISIAAAHPTLYRYDLIVLRLDRTARTVKRVVVKGEPAVLENITPPTITRNNRYCDIALAYILLSPNMQSVNAGAIIDARPDSSVCGFITGLITQVDTSQIYSGLLDWCDEQKRAMSSWENQMQLQFDAWLATLTSQLMVQTYIQKFNKYAYDPTQIIVLSDIPGYTYEASDVFFVNINGLLGIQNVDYTVYHDDNGTGIYLMSGRTSATGQPCVVDITILKSRIGFNTLVDANSNQIVTSGNDNVSLGG